MEDNSIAGRLCHSLRRQRETFAGMVEQFAALNVDELLDEQSADSRWHARVVATTADLDAEFTVLRAEWLTQREHATDEERSQIETLSSDVGRYVAQIEAHYARLAMQTADRKSTVHGELDALRRGRSMLRHFGASSADTAGYIDRRA